MRTLSQFLLIFAIKMETKLPEKTGFFNYQIPKLIYVLFLFFAIQVDGLAQITAAFTPSETEGCDKLLVTFTNESTPIAEIDSFKWDFGNGNISRLINPSALFPSPGIYAVKLIAYADNNQYETERVINVYNPPNADFTANNKGCVPHDVSFTDLSTPGDAAIESYKWDFKNGDVLSAEAPEYTYFTQGKYSITLTVMDANSCQDTVSKINYIDVVNPPVASFTSNPPSSCKAPVSVFFNNNSTGDPSLTYSWTFGDGNTSEEKSPTHLFESFGTYQVALTAASEYGCESSISSEFNVSEVTVDGSITQNGKPVETGDTICPGVLNFADASEGTGFILWDFGDGTASSAGNVAHSYDGAGMYEILLIASPNTSCADTLTWDIYVDGIKADYEADPAYSCLSPVDVNYNNTSENAETYHWEFSDGTFSDLMNPQKTFTLPPDTDPYAISASVPFSAKLTVTSSKGCQDEITKAVIVKKPTAITIPDTVQGCVPLKVNFADKSISDQEIINYTYLFGNGVSLVSDLPDTSYTYENAGVYQARVIIRTAAGCTDTSYHVTIKAGNVPNPNFSISSASVCRNESVQITDLTPPSDSIDSWHYVTDNQLFSSCPDEPNPEVYFRSSPGYKDISLTVGSKGCYATKIIDDAIMLEGPYGKFTYDFNCADPLNYSFTSLTEDITSFQWKISDGTQNSTDPVLSHTFASEGDYLVTLITYKNACTDTFSRNIQVRNNIAKIISDTMACAGIPLSFERVTTPLHGSGCKQNIVWDFDDDSRKIRTNEDSVSHTFLERGNYTVKLFVENDNGCIDSTETKIHVFMPYASFSADTLLGCAPFPVIFTDSSTPDLHPLNAWEINYGDGSSPGVFTSSPAAQSHIFQNPGEFTAVLRVTDTLGCTGTDTLTIKTANPSAIFSLTGNSSPNTCAGIPLQFTADYTIADSLFWDFGDGLLIKTDTSVHMHTYNTRGGYQVSLTTYKFGCSNTYTTDTNYIQIQKADAVFNSSDTVAKCYPEEITFNYADDDVLVYRYWDFGTGDFTEQPGSTKKYTYLEPGTFEVSHGVETSFGCKDTAIQEIVISGPSGSFFASKNNGCIGDNITFTLSDTSNVFDFKWDMGDGSLLEGNPVSHRYDVVDTIIVGLLLYGDSGSCIPPPVLDTIFINRVFADFSLSDTSICSGTSIIPENKAEGFTSLEWDLGNGNTTADITPEIWYDPGIYMLNLMVWNDINACRDTISRTVRVSPSPKINLSAEALICYGNKAQLSATGGDIIEWHPAAFIDDPAEYQTQASPETTTSFIAEITDTTYNCSTTDSLTIAVQQIPKISIIPADTAVVIGEEVELLVTADDTVTLEWLPGPALSCFTCDNPWIKVLNYETLTVEATDKNNCFTISDSVEIALRDVELNFDMPTAFTPNGDGSNDMLYVKGWGIKELLEFQVYNRWGNLVFSTTDIATGWDGTLQGVDQPIDTYVFNVVVKLYDDRVITKQGTINLLR